MIDVEGLHNDAQQLGVAFIYMQRQENQLMLFETPVLDEGQLDNLAKKLGEINPAIRLGYAAQRLEVEWFDYRHLHNGNLIFLVVLNLICQTLKGV